MRLPTTVRALLVAALAAAGAGAQDAGETARPRDPAGTRAGSIVPHSFIVLLEERSFDLGALLAAIADRRPAREVDVVVAGLDAAVKRDQTSFVEAIARLGGEVTHQWWIINGAAVRLPAGKGIATLRRLPGVDRVFHNRVHLPTLGVATDAQHHATDQANQRTVGGVALRGDGMGIAILDTGVDADVAGMGRPHRAYYPGGDPTNPTGGGLGGSLLQAALGTSGLGGEDRTFDGHGTHVSGCAGANVHADVDDGPAPGAGIVGVKISDDYGCAQTAWIVSGWQLVAARRAQHNIGVACNAYTGSPSLTDPIQQALDTTAWVADVAICASAGNLGVITSFSQRAYNGVAVGSIDKFTLQVSSFSGRGPLSGTQATYPDVVGVGSNVLATQLDNEAAGRVATGSSFATPIVAGILALVRQVSTDIDAREAMALLLNETMVRVGRNSYGLGIAQADLAVQAAIAGGYFTARVSQAAPVYSHAFTPPAGTRRVTVFYMRAGGAATPANLDIKVYDSGGQIVAQDGNPENNYEQVSFTAMGGASYRLEVTMTAAGSHQSVDFAVAGALSAPPVGIPTLTNISPGQVSTWNPTEVTLTGRGLGGVTQVTIGGQAAAGFTVDSPMQVRFNITSPWLIGSHNVVVTTAAGSSNALTLQVTGQHPPQLVAPGLALRGFPVDYKLYNDAGSVGLLFVAPTAQPSVLQGVVSLGIGSGFASLFTLTTLVCDSRGFAQFNLSVPARLRPAVLYFQAATLDGMSPAFPAEASNVASTSFF